MWKPDKQTKPKFYRPQRKLLERDATGRRIVLVSPYIQINGYIHKNLLELFSPVQYCLLSEINISEGESIENQERFVRNVERSEREPFLIIDFQKVRSRVNKFEYPEPVIDVVDFLGYQFWADSKHSVAYFALKEIYAECLKQHHEYDYKNDILFFKTADRKYNKSIELEKSRTTGQICSNRQR